MPTAIAASLIAENSPWRRFGLSSFESATPSIIVLGASITAAAITGPASAPTPASSTPATAKRRRRQSSCSKRKLGRARMLQVFVPEAPLSQADGNLTEARADGLD